MRTALFVMASFYPREDANTNCADRIMQGLEANGFSVTELTFTLSPDLPRVQMRGGRKTCRVYIPVFDRFGRLLQKPVFHRFSFVSAILRRAAGWIEGRAAKLSMRRRFLKACGELRCGEYDCMVSGLCPSMSHFLAFRAAKKFHVPWVMYNMDSFVFNTMDKTIGYRKRTEKKWCKTAAAVVNTLGLQMYNERNGYFPYSRLPQLEIPLPNLQIPDKLTPQTQGQPDKIRLLYAGSFHENVRRPDELFRFLAKLDPQVFSAEFYGNCCGYIREHGIALPACASLKGSVSAEACRFLTQDADILIDVGNDCVNQMPSKVFECIQSGKPILHFTGSEQELAMRFLQRYPRILHVHVAEDAGAQDLFKLLQTPPVAAQTLRELYADVLSETVCANVSAFIQTVTDQINKKKKG